MKKKCHTSKAEKICTDKNRQWSLRMRGVLMVVAALFFGSLIVTIIMVVFVFLFGSSSDNVVSSDDYDEGTAVALDSLDNVYITGFFSRMADFDPGPGTHNLMSNGYQDIFVSKLDSSGNFMWATQFGGDYSRGFGFDIAVDGLGNVYTVGGFRGTVDFDPGSGTYNLTSVGDSDIFVSKLDSEGDFIWASQMGGSNVGINGDIATNG